MMFNSTQKALTAISSVALLCLGLFPPWQQAAMREPFRKDIGRAFVLRPPAPVAVDCYFPGCKQAPPIYFHVQVHWEVLLAQLSVVFGVSVVALWVLRTRRDGTEGSLASNRTRLEISVLAASLFSPLGTFPLAVLLLDIPRQAVHRDELWFLPVIIVVVTYAICSLIVYGLLSSAVWLRNRLKD